MWSFYDTFVAVYTRVCLRQCFYFTCFYFMRLSFAVIHFYYFIQSTLSSSQGLCVSVFLSDVSFYRDHENLLMSSAVLNPVLKKFNKNNYHYYHKYCNSFDIDYYCQSSYYKYNHYEMIDNSLAPVTADMITIVIVVVAVIIIFLFVIWFYDKNIITDIINFLFPIVITIFDQMIIHYLTLPHTINHF